VRTSDVPPVRLLLIRHGETAWNAEGRIQGQLDTPLSSKGIWQAARLADRLDGERADTLLCSDLARARLTAEPLASALKLRPQVDPRLRERHFGCFQGFTMQEVMSRWPQEFMLWRSRDPAWRMDGGESGHQLIERVTDVLREIADGAFGRSVVAVAHGGVLDAAYRVARGLHWDAPRDHPIANCAVNRLLLNARPFRAQVDMWADTSHLDQPALDGSAP
jgi:probable phosphoglycerate mutase